jgi:hypothetical protein
VEGVPLVISPLEEDPLVASVAAPLGVVVLAEAGKPLPILFRN